MQGLVHVKESLRALQAQLGDARHADSADSWRELREKQYRAFSMPEERLLFARMVAREDEDVRLEAGMDTGGVPSSCLQPTMACSSHEYAAARTRA